MKGNNFLIVVSVKLVDPFFRPDPVLRGDPSLFKVVSFIGISIAVVQILSRF